MTIKTKDNKATITDKARYADDQCYEVFLVLEALCSEFSEEVIEVALRTLHPKDHGKHSQN